MRERGPIAQHLRSRNSEATGAATATSTCSRLRSCSSKRSARPPRIRASADDGFGRSVYPRSSVQRHPAHRLRCARRLRQSREGVGTSLLPSDRSELCLERLLEVLGREQAPRVDVRKSFANRREEATVFTQCGKLGCANEHGRGLASMQDNDCITRIVHASHEPDAPAAWCDESCICIDEVEAGGGRESHWSKLPAGQAVKPTAP